MAPGWHPGRGGIGLRLLENPPSPARQLRIAGPTAARAGPTDGAFDLSANRLARQAHPGEGSARG
jgi:hypothetical protein